jgi:hypothetical protein
MLFLLFISYLNGAPPQTNAKKTPLLEAAPMSLPESPLPPATADRNLWRRVTLAAMDGSAFVVSIGRGSW